jgi:hypothetical protein
MPITFVGDRLGEGMGGIEGHNAHYAIAALTACRDGSRSISPCMVPLAAVGQGDRARRRTLMSTGDMIAARILGVVVVFLGFAFFAIAFGGRLIDAFHAVIG